MRRLTITIPQQYNDGSLVPVGVLERIESDFVSRYGGYSRYSIAGAWTDSDGYVHHEFSYRYEILTGTHSAYNTLHQYAHRVSRELGQTCILTTCETVQADFVTG